MRPSEEAAICVTERAHSHRRWNRQSKRHARKEGTRVFESIQPVMLSAPCNLIARRLAETRSCAFTPAHDVDLGDVEVKRCPSRAVGGGDDGSGSGYEADLIAWLPVSKGTVGEAPIGPVWDASTGPHRPALRSRNTPAAFSSSPCRCYAIRAEPDATSGTTHHSDRSQGPQ